MPRTEQTSPLFKGRGFLYLHPQGKNRKVASVHKFTHASLNGRCSLVLFLYEVYIYAQRMAHAMTALFFLAATPYPNRHNKMVEDAQAIEQWKKKYYDQLDQLEKKEAYWEQLEAIFKRTIGRLTIAAEGQHESLDHHIISLRHAIKSQISPTTIDPIIDDISRILAQLEQKRSGPDRSITSSLQQLITNLNLSGSEQKAQKNIIRKLEKADDTSSKETLAYTGNFLSSIISAEPVKDQQKKGLLQRLLPETSSANNEKNDKPANISKVAAALHDFLSALPWPPTLQAQTQAIFKLIKSSSTEEFLRGHIQDLAKIAANWTTHGGTDVAPDNVGSDHFETYKDCLVQLISKLDKAESRVQLDTLKTNVQSASQEEALDELLEQLSTLLDQQSQRLDPERQNTPSLTTISTETTTSKNDHHLLSDESFQPSIQELLIHLIEQLVVPHSFQAQAERVKQNLENNSAAADWKQVLKEVADLINSIRVSMQAERHDIEAFLQQVTDRLKDMDLFLTTESSNLQNAQAHGQQFDQEMQSNVSTIRDDIHQATELPSLKTLVNKKLAAISERIQSYREDEQKRAQKAQDDVEKMHDRMQALEKETESLKKAVAEKNQQAMFDALTKVPNRLFYQQKISAEVARAQRSNTVLSLAIWDIDFFKKINDKYGHKAGDKVLETIAQLINSRIRESDFFARYGGEEFVMLLPETSAQEALILADTLREKISSCSFHYRGEDVKVTASCGISSFSHSDTPDQVFERADKALYKAKTNGRNQCVLADLSI